MLFGTLLVHIWFVLINYEVRTFLGGQWVLRAHLGHVPTLSFIFFFEFRTCSALWDFDRWILMTERVGYQKREKERKWERDEEEWSPWEAGRNKSIAFVDHSWPTPSLSFFFLFFSLRLSHYWPIVSCVAANKLSLFIFA